MRSMKVASVLFAMSMALGACGKGSKCEKAADKVIAMMGDMVKGMPEEAAKKMKEESAKMKSQFVEECKKKASDKEIDCVLAAKTMEDMDKCK